MTDRELLELAAKAAGVRYTIEDEEYYKTRKFFGLWLVYDDEPSEYARRYWNPRTDDGDALRLAVDLDFGIEVYRSLAVVHVGNGEQEKVSVYWNLKDIPDARTATRLAIVRAAAEIGKAMP